MQKVILSLILAVGFSSHAYARERVELKPKTGMVQAGMVDYAFDLIDTTTGTTISDTKLAVEMEKKLHMIVYDPSLNEFQHVHPIFDGTTWKVQLNFSVDGNYWVWAQGVVAAGEVEFSSPTRLMVMGGSAKKPVVSLGDVRKGSADLSDVKLGPDALVAGSTAMLGIRFSRSDGSPPVLTPYLGAMAHVVAVPLSGDSLQHAHVMDSTSNEGMIHTTFPSAGEYRLWIQFVDGGNLKVIPLSVVVTK